MMIKEKRAGIPKRVNVKTVKILIGTIKFKGAAIKL